MDADVVAIDVLRRMFFDRRIEFETDSLVEFVQKAFGRPSMLEKEEFETGAFAMLTQGVRFAEQLGNSFYNCENLIRPNESIQPSGEIWFRRQSTGNAQGKPGLARACNSACDRGQANVIDLRVRAPRMASHNRYLEFARQVVEIGIAREKLRYLHDKRRGIHFFVRIYSGDRAAGYVSSHVSAGADRIQADFPEAVQHVGKSLYRHPMKLDVLPHRQIGNSVCILSCEICYGVQLLRGQNAIRNPDADHESLKCASYAILAAGHPRSVALRIDTPPSEIHSDPVGRDRIKAFTGKAPDLLQPFPRIHGALQSFGALCFCLFHCGRHSAFSGK